MDRKTFEIELLDNKKYIFAERNREDVSFNHLQNKIRAIRTAFIEENIKIPDNQLPLLMQEMAKVYSITELNAYLETNVDELARGVVYPSFKINNAQIEFEKFQKLVDEPLTRKLKELIYELELIDVMSDPDVCKTLQIKKELLKSWKEDQPAVYMLIKKNVKKKPVV